MKVLVCGGRNYDGVKEVFGELDALQKEHGPLTVIQGGAPGADKLARDWCYKQRKVTMIHVPADWDQHGKAAGPIRNEKMIEEEPDLVIAFPGGRGTADLVKKAKKAAIEVKKVGWQ